MIEVGLFDGCFNGHLSATLGGENTGAPKHIRWVRGKVRPVTFYTDVCLEMARGRPGRKVAWLIEPPSLHDGHYRTAEAMGATFDYTLTFDRTLIGRHDPSRWLWYPLGGTWIAPQDWGPREKTKGVSLIASFKTGAEGHRLRHEIARKFEGRLDLMGSGYRAISSKLEGLAPYRYSVVVESCRLDDYFSEKLVDALLLGTIPIYWGSPSVSLPCRWRQAGIIPFGDLDELDFILREVVSEADYRRRMSAAVGNSAIAEGYTCAEDWLYRTYPFLFEAMA